jgi:hypothetical protein
MKELNTNWENLAKHLNKLRSPKSNFVRKMKPLMAKVGSIIRSFKKGNNGTIVNVHPTPSSAKPYKGHD